MNKDFSSIVVRVQQIEADVQVCVTERQQMHYEVKSNLVIAQSQVIRAVAKYLSTSVSADAYKLTNVIAWLRRFNREKKKCEQTYKPFVNRLTQLEEALFDCAAILSLKQEPDEQTVQLIKRAKKIKQCIYKEIHFIRNFMKQKPFNEDWLSYLTAKPFTLSKHDLYQLITVKRDVYRNMEQRFGLVDVPVLNFEQLQNLILIGHVEAVKDCYLFDVFIEHIKLGFERISEHPDLLERMLKKMEEIYGPIENMQTF